MSSLTKRTVILVICRVTNYGVQFLSPVFLVRIFNVRMYGQYREFVLYAMLLAVFLSFAIPTNLIYFIPRYPARSRSSVTNSALLLLASSLIGLLGIFLARDFIRAKTSYDFVFPLMAYLFFFVNLDFFEGYALGRRQSLAVLFYSTARIAARIGGIVLAAYFTRDLATVFKVMIAIEAAKSVVLLFIFRGQFTRTIDFPLMREQLRFILPLGASGVITFFNTELAKLVISITMGVERLALYTIGSYQIPIINIVRTSVIDVLFPEMTQADDRMRLRLWQRANIAFCFMIFPLFALFFYHARTFIDVVFTDQYIEATTLFRIYLGLLVLHCFEMGTPLRTINQTRFFVLGSILSLIVDIGFILALLRLIGFVAPAIAILLGEFIVAIYLGRKIMDLYKVPLRGLLMWGSILKIALACVAALPVLFMGELYAPSPLLRAAASGVGYLGVYALLVRRLRVEEADIVVSKALALLRRALRLRA